MRVHGHTVINRGDRGGGGEDMRQPPLWAGPGDPVEAPHLDQASLAPLETDERTRLSQVKTSHTPGAPQPGDES